MQGSRKARDKLQKQGQHHPRPECALSCLSVDLDIWLPGLEKMPGPSPCIAGLRGETRSCTRAPCKCPNPASLASVPQLRISTSANLKHDGFGGNRMAGFGDMPSQNQPHPNSLLLKKQPLQRPEACQAAGVKSVSVGGPSSAHSNLRPVRTPKSASSAHSFCIQCALLQSASTANSCTHAGFRGLGV